MDDSKYGTEDSKGYWIPHKRVSYGPVFSWPPQPRALVKFFFGVPGYFLPSNVLYAILAVFIWVYLTPPLETLRTLSADWVLLVLGRNLLLTLLIVGAWHLWLYTWKKQGNLFKFNRRWPAEKSSVFTFNNQTADNMFWSLASGVPIWTAYEVLMLWAYANGAITLVSPEQQPWLFGLLFFLVPVIHEAGFYFVHRLLHWPPLYRVAHALHHRNTNPGPWSGLSMHPLEHVLYFCTVLLFFLIPSHPIHMINLLSRLGVAPAQGHTGFARMVTGKDSSFDSEYYAHYLHHRYFEVNYGDGMIPLDKWFGSFHDGSDEAHERMLARRKRRGV
ncbi:MAG: sterol desaturase family protein [Gammaproteobacteria bacterium]|nr:sterol desaturase family protein [Gammaproteobacteria bacterium]